MRIPPHCYPPSEDGCDCESLVFSLFSINLDEMHQSGAAIKLKGEGLVFIKMPSDRWMYKWGIGMG